MSDTLTKEDVQLHIGTDPSDYAHYTRKKKITEAYVLGTVLVALCGYEFVPTKNPEKLPICPNCKALHEDNFVMDNINPGEY